MAFTVQGIGNFDVQLGNATAAVFSNTLGPGFVTVMTRVTADNTNLTNAHVISLYRNSGGGDTGADQIISNLSISAGLTVDLPLSGQSLSNGQSLDGVADFSGNVTISGTYAVVSPS